MTQRKVGRQSADSAQQTRKSILLAAMDLFCEQGYKQVTIRGISERAGVSHSLIRHYFGTKLQIWQQVSDDLHVDYQKMQDQLINSIDKELPINHQLYLLVIKLLAQMLLDPRPLRLLEDALEQDPEQSEYLLQGTDQSTHVIRSLTDRCKEQGFLEDIETGELLWLTTTFAHSNATLSGLLTRKIYPEYNDVEQAKLANWYMFSRIIAQQLAIPAHTMLRPVNLAEVLSDVASSECS